MGRITATDDQRLTTVGLLLESAAGLRRVFERRFESERALSHQSFDVLIRLARTPGFELRMSELASQTSLTPSGLTRSVDRLAQQGLVGRRVCPEDRRGVRRTHAGRAGAHGPGYSRAPGPRRRAAHQPLHPEEEAMLSDLLRKLRDHLFDANAEWGLTHEDRDTCPGSD